MLRMIVYTLGFILLYRLIVNFILPVFRMTKLANERVRQMQDQMNNMQQSNQYNNNHHQASQRIKEGDYIDYEEVK
ncbi:hypothetical protein [Taibaiella soli]|uniref:ATP synthase YMF19-like N-terminal domain-containing protein n=1 Tax=Taibaiella soli TaxID=1649169 RepID=A0A2W2BDE0_9BACT|nr:hypothetical protein [Taibaiella soli]PZF73887.1 hypothetical protein DN068_05975 [Taibaiella soli]